MSVKLQLKSLNINDDEREQAKLHYLPCSIDENIQTNLTNQFENYTTEKDGGK